MTRSNQFSKLSLSIITVNSIILFISLFCSFYFENYYLLSIPFILIIGSITFIDFKKTFYFLLFLLPLSIEYSLPNGIATDLPTEPLMILLTLLFFIYLLIFPKKFDVKFLHDPIIQLLLLHIFWTGITVIYSSIYHISVKFLLAKIWYITTFVFLTGMIIKSRRDFKKVFWAIFIPLLMVVIITFIRHAQYNFSFSDINKPVYPFFRNHVNYACMIVSFYPFCWLAATWYPKGSIKRIFINFSKILFLAAIYFSYTRAAWLALIIAGISYFIIKKNYIKLALVTASSLLILLITFLAYENNYLKFTSDFKKTIIHENLDDHMIATYELEDLSSMERVYRWISACKMSIVKPITGFGPGNFYHHYKSHTVSAFTTWVSDNPEKSGVHNYFLMILVEQGFIGLFIFIVLIGFILIKGQKIFNDTTIKQNKLLILTIIVSTIIIVIVNFLSDLIEVDKVGSLFFINIAILVNMNLSNKRLEKSAGENSNIIHK